MHPFFPSHPKREHQSDVFSTLLTRIPGAVAISVALVNANGNANLLTLVGETYRWTQEFKVVTASTPKGEPVGLIDPGLLSTEYKAYVEAGVWPKGAPPAARTTTPASPSPCTAATARSSGRPTELTGP